MFRWEIIFQFRVEIVFFFFRVGFFLFRVKIFFYSGWKLIFI